jgi:hypothetical protein
MRRLGSGARGLVAVVVKVPAPAECDPKLAPRRPLTAVEAGIVALNVTREVTLSGVVAETGLAGIGSEVPSPSIMGRNGTSAAKMVLAAAAKIFFIVVEFQ